MSLPGRGGGRCFIPMGGTNSKQMGDVRAAGDSECVGESPAGAVIAEREVEDAFLRSHE